MNHEPQIRAAEKDDSPRIARLLAELGYERSSSELAQTIPELAKSELDRIIVATVDDEVVGAAGLHMLPLLAEGDRLGRITALVVGTGSRRLGIGRLLVESLEEFAQGAGCSLIEVTTGARRSDAQAFYGEMGYQEAPVRFLKRPGWNGSRRDPES